MDNYDFFDEKTFYPQFIKDLLGCKEEVYIESPFIACARMIKMYPVFERLIRQGIKVYVVTRDPQEHVDFMEQQAEYEIQKFERLGIQVFIGLGSPHRKIAMLDRKITWEGSLNILSQSYSREMMRRTNSEKAALRMFDFLRLDRLL